MDANVVTCTRCDDEMKIDCDEMNQTRVGCMQQQT